VGDTSLARLQTFADGIGASLWDAILRADEVGLAPASLRAVQSLRSLLQSLMAVALDMPVAELVERVLEKSGYLEALEAERTIEARGRIENLEGSSCRRSRSTRSRTTCPTRAPARSR
jgi:DNA helicase-2/ATP-dependent DNA helicase PcrA